MKIGSGALAASLMANGFGASKSGEARVTVDASKVTGDISPLIYGQFIEHLGRAIYGGIYDAGSQLSDEKGFRKDVLEKVRGLRTPLLRYPGGTVTKIYHWKDGIGPRAERPVRRNLIWGGEDNNHVGTDEFIDYCRLIDAAPFLTVNMSTGTAEEASQWVEYCNATGNSEYAVLRRKNGHAAPHNVKLWGLGNEEAAGEDAGLLQDPSEYVKRSWYYAKLMKLQDPNIELILVGHDAPWNKTVLEGLHPIGDYLSLHLYAGSQPGQSNSIFSSVANMERRVVSASAQIKTLTPPSVENFSRWYRFPPRKQPVKLALDEWGIWEAGGEGAYALEQTYNWNHALAVASFLNMFQRHSGVIGMATWAQTVNVLAPLMTNDKSVVCQTIYYPMALYRQLCGTRAVLTECDCGALPDTENVSLLDVAASVDDSSRVLTIAVVNRSPTESVDVQLDVVGGRPRGQWTLHELNASAVDAVNTLRHPEKNVVKHSTRSLPTNTRRYLVAAHGVAIFQVGLG